MSKLSFRSRALDTSRAMPIYESSEIPDITDFTSNSRQVPRMPTGMEKEEESETHLQRALSAQQAYGTSEALVIPTPEITHDNKYANKLYAKDFKMPKQYIHVQPFNVDHEIPDYDMDSEDEVWLQKQSKKMEVKPVQFEEMMDRLEKGSGQTVVTLPEAKMLLKEDDDLIIAVYDYWLNKRLRMQCPLIHTVKTEKRDGSTTNNPYVAFRRRTEKMQTRKNRKNDEVSYEKMLKLRRDLSKAVTQLEMIKRREKTKKELLQLTIEVIEKRFQMGDFNGEKYADALAQKNKMPAFVPVNHFPSIARDWIGISKKEDNNRKRKDYKKRKHRPSTSLTSAQPRPLVHVPQYSEVDVMTPDLFSSDEDLPSSAALSPSDHDDDSNDPDGVYAFRRMKGCSYLAPSDATRPLAWPWSPGPLNHNKYRYSLTSLSEPRRCIGYARRRYGRGGRIVLDRAWSEHDKELNDLDLWNGDSYHTDLSHFNRHINQEQIPHYRPRTPQPDELQSRTDSLPLSAIPEELRFEEAGAGDLSSWMDITASLTQAGLVLDADSAGLEALLAAQTVIPALPGCSSQPGGPAHSSQTPQTALPSTSTDDTNSLDGSNLDKPWGIPCF